MINCNNLMIILMYTNAYNYIVQLIIDNWISHIINNNVGIKMSISIHIYNTHIIYSYYCIRIRVQHIEGVQRLFTRYV